MAALRRREIGAAELLEAVPARADEITGPVNPFAVRLDETVLLGRRPSPTARSPRHRPAPGGLPIPVKHSHWLAGVPTSSASMARSGFVPTQTVGAVARLLAAGAVVFAKTTTSEFCYTGVSTAPAFGVTANPHDLTRTRGRLVRRRGGRRRGLGRPGRRSAATAAARSASRPRSAGWSGTNRRSGWCPHEPSGPGLEDAGRRSAR